MVFLNVGVNVGSNVGDSPVSSNIRRTKRAVPSFKAVPEERVGEFLGLLVRKNRPH